MAEDFDPRAFKKWSAPAQERALAELREVEKNTWRPFYCPRLGCDGKPHDDWVFLHARANQHPPKGDWLTWLILGGRGGGKTRTGAEWVNRMTRIAPRIAIVGPTGPDARDIQVEGESGILAKAAPGSRPEWEPSKKKLTWPNGAQAHVFSGEEPDRLRGPQHFAGWVDEPSHIDLIDEVWANLLFGMRLGDNPRICATTTPIPNKWTKETFKDETTVAVNMRTYDNLDNLAPHFRRLVLTRYEGTRMGKQEIEGMILEDVEGALWSWGMIEGDRVAVAPPMDRVVVAVDPAGTVKKGSDETGIIVVGTCDGHYYVMADLSGVYSPDTWARRTMGAHDDYGADAVVPESNYGGDMVTTVLRSADSFPRILPVHSRRGKVIRAEPIVGLYERHLVHHLPGLGDLEEQLTTWVPGTDSPDRLDALVHGITELAHVVEPSAVADPTTLGRVINLRRAS